MVKSDIFRKYREKSDCVSYRHKSFKRPVPDMDEVRKHIIRKLFFRRCIGGKHTAVEHALAGIPRDRRKDATAALKRLAHDGIVLLKPTNYGLHVSLNPKALPTIRKSLDD